MAFRSRARPAGTPARPGEPGILAGWTRVFGEDTRDACLAYVAEHWTDLRPLRRRRRMDGLA
jgi:uncharacterized protein YbdZ (MbtH family)